MKRYTYKFIPEVQKFVVFDGEEVKAMYKGRDKAFLECNRLNAAHDQGKKAANAEDREKEIMIAARGIIAKREEQHAQEVAELKEEIAFWEKEAQKGYIAIAALEQIANIK